MKEIAKLVSLVMLVLSSYSGFAQYNALQVNLEIQTPRKEHNKIRISLYQEDSASFLLGIKRNPIFNPNDDKTWLKRDSDTVLKIRKEDFSSVAKEVMSLSSFEILKGMNPSVLMIGSDGVSVNLEIDVNTDKISYCIGSPTFNTKERNLEQYLAICREILLLAKINPKDYLR